jgi:hypothetical protein
MPTIAELLEARGDIAKLEALQQRAITEDELMPLLHNRRVGAQEYEQGLKAEYREKVPTYLNAENLEVMCLLIATCNLLEHYAREWLKYNKPKKAIQFLKTAKTFLEKSIAEFTRELPLEEKLRLIREATKRIEGEGRK